MPSVKIGVEVHVGLCTQSKMFCQCANESSSESSVPNSRVCEVCLGFPGSKPSLNKKVVEYGVKLALALNCDVLRDFVFSRKTYFYPDMSKNFQITQYEFPVGVSGSLMVDGVKINIKRVHIEEDPAAVVRLDNSVLVDYNRSGCPLAEIVTEPDFQNPEQVRAFMNKLVSVLKYLGVFDEASTIKADVNVSVEKTGFTRVEVKNVTGFKEIERALLYEIERQNEEGAVRETRGWDDQRGITYSQRSKESEEDYGYIVEPDLSCVELSEDLIAKLKLEIPELADEKAERYVELGVAGEDAKVIAAEPVIARLFEETCGVDPVLVSKWFRKEVLRVYNDQNGLGCITAKSLKDVFALVAKKSITDKTGRDLIQRLGVESVDVDAFVKSQDLTAVDDVGMLKDFCEEAIKNNFKAVEDFKKGEEKALNFIVGYVMKKSRGKAVPDVVAKMIKEMI